MQYCSTCVLPDTRPNISFAADGSCNCATKAEKDGIDWEERESIFIKLVKSVKERRCSYDCVVPVSGGKDSTWQTVKALELGLNPICVTWRTPARNTLGKKNLDNLISLGVTHIDVTINPITERLFTLRAFERYGNPVIPMHMALHAIPLQFAVNYHVPLILWGENSAFEYGGNNHLLKGLELNHAWLKEYGVTNGTTADDWVDHNNLTYQAMSPYRWPSDEAQSAAGVKAVFLGQYFRWDPSETFNIAQLNGFEASDTPKTGYYRYADIDDAFLITIHHWMKWFKFGFTRLWDNLSIEIRNGRMSRDEAIDLIKSVGPEHPEEEIDQFCAYTQISREYFFEIVESFRNQDIWKRNAESIWTIPKFLITDWIWQ